MHNPSGVLAVHLSFSKNTALFPSSKNEVFEKNIQVELTNIYWFTHDKQLDEDPSHV